MRIRASGNRSRICSRSFDGGQATRFLRASFEDDLKLDWEQDVKAALGDEISLVWLDFKNQGENVVGITKPQDEEKFRAAVQKGNASDLSGDDLIVGEHEDWLLLSDSQAKIDRFKQQVPTRQPRRRRDVRGRARRAA